MKRFSGNKWLSVSASAGILLAVWYGLTLVYPPLIVPPIPAVLGRVWGIVRAADSWRVIGLTAFRLLAGLTLGVTAGTGVGAALGRSSSLHAVFRPLVGLAQSTPLVSWLVLALLWFGFNGRASVFIVAVATFPVMVVNIVEGVRGIEPKLLQMAKVYRFSRKKTLLHIVLPSVLPSFRSGLHVAIGLASKTVVMGEVLTTASGIGGEITNARLNLEPEGIVAWTVVVVCLYALLDMAAGRLLAGRRRAAS